jgi:hypothetical protein
MRLVNQEAETHKLIDRDGCSQAEQERKQTLNNHKALVEMANTLASGQHIKFREELIDLKRNLLKMDRRFLSVSIDGITIKTMPYRL